MVKLVGSLVAIILVYALAAVRDANGARILALFPTQAHSHWTPVGVLLEELANRGHHVTVYTHYLRDTPLKNYSEIQLADNSAAVGTGNFTYDIFSQLDWFAMLMITYKMGGTDICQEHYTTTQIQDLIHSENEYDLFITETLGSECFVALAHKFRAPWISFSFLPPFNWVGAQVDLPEAPAYAPHPLTTYSGRMGLLERTGSLLFHVASMLGFHYFSRVPSQRVVCEAFGTDDCPDLSALSRTASLLLSNSHFSLTGARPGVPGHVEVGGIHISKEPAPLPKELQKLLDGAEDGFVYFCFGSLAQSESLPRASLDAMLAAFSQLSQLVLWKTDTKNFPKDLILPPNVVTRPWLPQRDVLAHHNIKLFITHGGLLGTMEAVYCAVPLLGIPLFADQMSNIKNYVEKGFARMLPLSAIPDDFKTDLSEMLSNPIYKLKALEASAQFRDRPATPLDTAVFWTEYVLRHGGAAQLRSPAKHLHWAQIWMLDVFAMLVGGVLVALVGVLIAFKFTLKLVRLHQASNGNGEYNNMINAKKFL